MRKAAIMASAGLMLALCAPATAERYKGFETTISQTVSYPVKIEVSLGDDMAYRADHLPEKLRDRGSSVNHRDGFSGNGYYGQRDLDQLTETLESKLTKSLTQAGMTVSDDAPATLKITLIDARPNHPTMEQMSKQPGLSMQSIANGGASVKAELIGPDGQDGGMMSYGWYENDIRYSDGKATWSDARRAFGRFSKKAAKTLTGS